MPRCFKLLLNMLKESGRDQRFMLTSRRDVPPGYSAHVHGIAEDVVNPCVVVEVKTESQLSKGAGSGGIQAEQLAHSGCSLRIGHQSAIVIL